MALPSAVGASPPFRGTDLKDDPTQEALGLGPQSLPPQISSSSLLSFLSLLPPLLLPLSSLLCFLLPPFSPSSLLPPSLSPALSLCSLPSSGPASPQSLGCWLLAWTGVEWGAVPSSPAPVSDCPFSVWGSVRPPLVLGVLGSLWGLLWLFSCRRLAFGPSGGAGAVARGAERGV